MVKAVLAALAVLCLAEPALAAHAVVKSEFRQWWDLAWKILNFLVLAGVIVKLATKPLKDFLAGQKAQKTEELAAMEQAKAEAAEQYRLMEQKIAGLKTELADYEGHMQQVMERERNELIEKAEMEADAIMHRATLQAERELERARAELTKEMLNLAADMAAEKISKAINEDDLHKMVQEFAEGVEARTA